MTVNEILDDLLEQVPDEYDTSEGSFFYDLLYPVAVEIQVLYNKIDVLEQNAFALTAIGEYLDRKVAEQGITRNAATFAKGTLRITGTPGSVILQGAKAATDSMLYAVDETVEIPDRGVVDVEAVCIIEGSSGNTGADTITRFPVTLPGLTSVTNPAEFTGGYDAESDADLLERYLEKVSRPNVSGNSYHYIEWAKEVSGVGDVQVIPLWNGPGTVKVVIVDSDGQPAETKLIAKVQAYIDECRPVGADVTVESAEAKEVNITAFIDTEVADFDVLKANISTAISAYLADEAAAKMYVSYAKVCAAIMSVDGVDDCGSLRFVSEDGAETTASFPVPEGYIPVLGELNIVKNTELHIAI